MRNAGINHRHRIVSRRGRKPYHIIARINRRNIVASLSRHRSLTLVARSSARRTARVI